jgi:hypothetical protein
MASVVLQAVTGLHEWWTGDDRNQSLLISYCLNILPFNTERLMRTSKKQQKLKQSRYRPGLAQKFPGN